jgi:hypothetical protein
MSSLLGAAVSTLEERVAQRLRPREPEPVPELSHGDGEHVALEHLRSAWRALRKGGRTDAQVSRELRLMINGLEAGRADRPN